MQYIVKVGDKLHINKKIAVEVIDIKQPEIGESECLSPIFVVRELNGEGTSTFSKQALECILTALYCKGIKEVINIEVDGSKLRSERIRNLTGLNRTQFGRRYNIPLRTLEAWDKGIAAPPIYVLNFLEEVVKHHIFPNTRNLNFYEGGDFVGFTEF